MKDHKITIVFAALLTAAFLAGCMCLPAALAAADLPSPDPGEKGSVSVTLRSGETGETPADGSLTLYRVADLVPADGNMAYIKTDDFAGYEGDLNVEDTALAGELASYIAENGLTGTDADISSGGEASFENLTLGLYVIIQTTQSAGFYAIDPFLVTVPVAENDRWVYNVDAGPKTEVNPMPEATPTPGETPVPSETPAPSETPESGPSPTPSMSVPPGGGGGNGGGGNPNTGKNLPQTGQLNWPVALFSVPGVILVAAGIVLVNTGRKKRHSET